MLTKLMTPIYNQFRWKYKEVQRCVGKWNLLQKSPNTFIGKSKKSAIKLSHLDKVHFLEGLNFRV